MEKELLVPPIGHSNTWVSVPIPRWVEALRSEIKKHRDLLTKLEAKQHGTDSRKEASAQHFIFEFGIKGVRGVLNKHNKKADDDDCFYYYKK